MNLTRREQIAAMALQGLLANPVTEGTSYKTLVADAVTLTDTLIAELDRTAKEQQP